MRVWKHVTGLWVECVARGRQFVSNIHFTTSCFDFDLFVLSRTVLSFALETRLYPAPGSDWLYRTSTDQNIMVFLPTPCGGSGAKRFRKLPHHHQCQSCLMDSPSSHSSVMSGQRTHRSRKTQYFNSAKSRYRQQPSFSALSCCEAKPTESRLVEVLSFNLYKDRQRLLFNTASAFYYHKLRTYLFYTGPAYTLLPNKGGKYMIKLNGYTYSQYHEKIYYCSKRKAGCKARVKLDADDKILNAFEEHSHYPPEYMRTAYGSYIKLQNNNNNTFCPHKYNLFYVFLSQISTKTSNKQYFQYSNKKMLSKMVQLKIFVCLVIMLRIVPGLFLVIYIMILQ